MALYVVRKGRGFWELHTFEYGDPSAGKKDWWVKRLANATHFTSRRAAERVAKRTGGVVMALVPTLVRGANQGGTK